MGESNSTKMPQSPRGEMALTLAKIGVSFIPVAGGAASEILAAIVTPLLEKRRTEWFEKIASGLEELKEKVENLTPESLSENESFVTTFLHATQASLRNHQQEKLEALRNAVLNAAMPNAPDDDLQLLFLDAVDTMTTWHLRILAHFDKPMRAVDTLIVFPPGYTGADLLLEHRFPELKNRRNFYDLLFNELASRGFVDGDATTLHIGQVRKVL